MSNKRYVVIIEWGGIKPPGQWYRSLVRLASLDVRFDPAREATPAEILAEHGVVLQEGVIMCESHSLARAIAALAKTGMLVNHKDGDSTVFKAKTVLLAECDVEDFHMNQDDSATLARMRDAFGKRGNPGRAADYAVTCFEEMTTHYHKTTSVVNCPNCLATHARWRAGDPNRFADPGGELFYAWVRMRFSTGRWEPPLEGDDLPPETIKFSISAEKQFVESLLQSPLLEQIDSVERNEAMRLLDAAFVARLYTSDQRRAKARAEVIAELLQHMPDLSGINLEETRKVDLLDAALGATERVAKLFAQWSERQRQSVKVTAEKKHKNFVSPVATGYGVNH